MFNSIRELVRHECKLYHQTQAYDIYIILTGSFWLVIKIAFSYLGFLENITYMLKNITFMLKNTTAKFGIIVLLMNALDHFIA